MSKKMELRDYLYSSMFSVMIIVLGYVSIPLPFSPVPVTGQSLAIMLAGSILTVKQSALSVGIFISLGVVGLPAFAGGGAGLGVIFGPTGGYIIGFLIGAMVISLIKGENNNPLRIGLSNFLGGVVVVYVFGVLWLNYVTNMGMLSAFSVGVLPFLVGDLFKVFIATGVTIPIKNQLKVILRM